MKNRIFYMAAVTMLVIALAGASFAANPTDVTVTANVQNVCSFVLPATGATTIALGNLDPSTGGPVSGNTLFGAAARCTKGHPFTATLGAGNNGVNNLSNGTDTIAYTPSYACQQLGAPVACTGQGFGAGKDLDVQVSVSILGTAYQDVSGGAYTDIFTVTLNP